MSWKSASTERRLSSPASAALGRNSPRTPKPEIADSQPASEAAYQGEIIVEISQHSSFPYDQYTKFSEPSSSQQSNITEEAGAIFGTDTSVTAEGTLLRTTLYLAGVVPDSQSLPNSSSYVPINESKTATDFDLTQQTVGDLSFSTDRLLVATGGRFLYDTVIESSDPIGSSSHSVLEAAITLRTANLRSARPRRLPLELGTADANPQLEQLPDSAGDIRTSNADIPTAQERDDICVQNYKNSTNGSIETLLTLSSTVRPDTQRTAPFRQLDSSTTTESQQSAQIVTLARANSAAASLTEVALTTDRQILKEAQPTPSLVGKKSCSIFHDHQQTPRELIQRADEVWQSGQVDIHRPRSTSKASSWSQESLESLSPDPAAEEQAGDVTAASSVTSPEPSLTAESPFESSQWSKRSEVSTFDHVLQSYGLGISLRSTQPQAENILESVETAVSPLESPSGTAAQGISSLSGESVAHSSDHFTEQCWTEVEMSDNSEPAVVQSSGDSHLGTMPGPAPPSLREKLRIMRAASAASSAAAKRTRLAESPALSDGKSPSQIPEAFGLETAENPHSDAQTVESPLSARPAAQSGSYTPIKPSKLSLHREMSSQPSIIKELKAPRLGTMEFVVSLPLTAQVRDQYVAIVGRYSDTFKKIVGLERLDEGTKQDIKRLLTQVSNVITHADIDNDTTNSDEDPEHIAIWSANCSTKFLFLQSLLDLMRYQRLHIAIVCRGGRLLDIMEKFLTGIHLSYNRPDTSTTSDGNKIKGLLQVSLVRSGREGSSIFSGVASLVIAFDSSFNSKEPQIQALRNNRLNGSHLSPVVHLLVYSAAEHIMKCIPESITGVDRLRAIASCVAQSRQEAGDLLPDEASPEAAAEEVVAFIEAGSVESQWTLPYIRSIEIDGFELVDSSQSVETASQPESAVGEESTPSSGILKRVWVS